LYISDSSILKKNVKNFIDDVSLKYVKLKYINYLTPSQMCKYYNESKINLIFSGRDAFPRTITESLACGCYNIALDTLSDGKNVINNIFGTVIGDENSTIKFHKSRSISYINNNIFWKQIIYILNQYFDHQKISTESIKLYNNDNIISIIYILNQYFDHQKISTESIKLYNNDNNNDNIISII